MTAATAMGQLDELSVEAQQVGHLRKEVDLLTHKIITCGVAATHPDANLTRAGAYAGKWDSPQAEAVRALRAERDALAARNAELEAALERIAQDSDPAGNLSEIARAALNLNKGPRS